MAYISEGSQITKSYISEKANEYKEDVTWVWQCMPETQHTAGRVGKIINEFEAALVYMLNLRPRTIQ